MPNSHHAAGQLTVSRSSSGGDAAAPLLRTSGTLWLGRALKAAPRVACPEPAWSRRCAVRPAGISVAPLHHVMAV